ncbi:aspartate/glutamate racemase family protein [Burkholderia gladioli]|uniref:aspartate/glutamate racemase family protein n=1 Tax=Burkholderia gladioli TaxID=28095 RepID=UPI001641EDA0|nr:amino acid racemase [Burkholderia gladioli]MCA8170211.1 aspartate/glutamate racemase family protein [Burkholderia gladioli]MDD1785811.1 aspartate/glutamate racemase family protein [Burkholderia gladioli]
MSGASLPAGAPARRLGIVGGLGPLAGADLYAKLMRAAGTTPIDAILAQHPLRGAAPDREASAERKLHVFDLIREFEQRGVTTVVLPCFLSHTFLDELRANTSLAIVDLVEAVREHVRRAWPGVRRVGVLASAATRERRLFERYFAAPEFSLCHPGEVDGIDAVTEAVYGVDGIREGALDGRPVELLRRACASLIEQGAEVIVPGLTEIALVLDALGPLPVPLVDPNQVYARRVLAADHEGAHGGQAEPFRIGVVGGVGPAATVDFLRKLVQHTPAARDQDHLKLIVEQNPQIPDRTAHLVGEGPDPTVSLYAACKRLEQGGAKLVAIPCNTAHAFVERIQPRLSIPIVNMLTVTARHLRERFPEAREIGVLATSGTLASGVYREALAAEGFVQLVPPPALQARVMAAIYGEAGVKAGFVQGRCREDIEAALDALVAAGARVVLLGCTELPLLLPAGEIAGPGGVRVNLVDPTEVLARACVAAATGAANEAANEAKPRRFF